MPHAASSQGEAPTAGSNATAGGHDPDLVLHVEGLHVHYPTARGPVRALDGVDLALRRGEVLGVAGESGCGKSTLAGAILRLLRPPAQVMAGSVCYHQRPDHSSPEANNTTGNSATVAARGRATEIVTAVDILTLRPRQLRALRWQEIAIVFQSAMNALNPVLSLRAQLVDVLHAHAPHLHREEREERAKALLRMVGIPVERLGSFPHELSGGMRQRAVIAIALALEPEVLIMDEPTTALDVVMQRDILAELAALRARLGFAVIFITHDLSLLLEMSDRVAVMYAGRVVEQAATPELAREPLHPYSQGLLASFPSLHGERRRLHGIPGSPPDLRAVPSGCAFHPRCPQRFAPCDHVTPVLAAPAVSDGSATVAPPARKVACLVYDTRFGTEVNSPRDLELPGGDRGDGQRGAATHVPVSGVDATKSTTGHGVSPRGGRS